MVFTDPLSAYLNCLLKMVTSTRATWELKACLQKLEKLQSQKLQVPWRNKWCCQTFENKQDTVIVFNTATSLDKLWFINGYNQLKLKNKKLQCMGHLE